MTKPPELFSPERPVRSDFARQSTGIPYVLRRLITLAVVVGLAAGGMYWVWHHASSGPAEIPTIKADGTYKQRPDQPGGIDIPHQDVQVYHEIDGSAEAKTTVPPVEHMLPPPEEPNLSSLPTTGSSSIDSVPSPHIETLTPTTVSEAPSSSAVPPPVETPVVSTPVPPPAMTTVTPSVANAPVQTPAPLPIPTMKTEEVAPVAKKGSVVVQLAALPDESAAQATMQKLQSKYSSILGTARLHSVRADLGGKGIFYRIQSQPLPQQQAQAICVAVKNRNAGCLLVRQ